MGHITKHGQRIEAACLWTLESSLGPRQYHATKCQCCCRQSEVAVDARQSSNSRCGRCNRVVAACAPGPSRIPNASLPVPRLIWSSPCVVAIHLAEQPAIASIQYVRLASDHCLISFFKKNIASSDGLRGGIVAGWVWVWSCGRRPTWEVEREGSRLLTKRRLFSGRRRAARTIIG